MSRIRVGAGVRWLKWTGVLLAFGFVSFVASMEVTDYLEEDNHFCIACHLHGDIFKNFMTDTPRLVALAGAHTTRGRSNASIAISGRPTPTSSSSKPWPDGIPSSTSLAISKSPIICVFPWATAPASSVTRMAGSRRRARVLFTTTQTTATCNLSVSPVISHIRSVTPQCCFWRRRLSAPSAMSAIRRIVERRAARANMLGKTDA